MGWSNRQKEFEIMKNELIKTMTSYLEDMCAYLTTGKKDLFYYNAGKADAIRTILEEQYGWDERYASEHIKNMWDIMDENW